MIARLFKKCLSTFITLSGVFLLTFALLHVVPGGPFESERGLPPEIEQNLYNKYGLAKKQSDESFLSWFSKDVVSYSKHLFHMRLGPSLKYPDRDVGQILTEAFPTSITLGICSLLLSLGLAITTSLLLVYQNNRFYHRSYETIASLMISLPGFVKGIILISCFSLGLKILPPALITGPESYILPILTLSIGPYFTLTEFLLNEITQEKQRLHITATRAKGIGEWKIIYKHVFKNSLSPLLAIVGPVTTSLITGSFVVESIFSIPGLGRHFVMAIIDRDFFLVMAITLLFAAILITLNLMTDFISEYIDPRLKIS